MRTARPLLAAGLVASAVLLMATGGWSGAAFGVVHGALGIALWTRPESVGLRAGAALALIPPPLIAAWHWAARTGVVCACARLPHSPPGLVSLTGLAVLLDAVLLALAVAMTAPHRLAQGERTVS